MRKLRMVVTAGPTWEPLDPIRGLTNRSTGMMGLAVMAAVRQRGHQATLVTGPISLKIPRGLRLIRVMTAREMRRAVLKTLMHADALVMTAAVADYRPARVHRNKLKRAGQALTLRLVENPDILAEAGRRFGGRKILIGFALESERIVSRARRKLHAKRLDLIVGNTVRAGRVTVGAQPLSDVVLLDRHGVQLRRRCATKPWVAARIVDFIEQHAHEGTRRGAS